MNVGSLFSGIGGLDLGLERAGMRVVFQAESDEWRRALLRERFPGCELYEDVADVCREQDRRPVRYGCGSQRDSSRTGQPSNDAVALLCGGFPCQDLSVAGRRAGLGGERSGLFFEFVRIAESLQPRWLLLENVPGLLSSNGGRDFGVVLESLAGVGYGVAWRILDSRYFGVPQRRRRVFILGARADGDPRRAAERAGAVLAVGTRCERHSQARGEARQDVAGTLGASAGAGRGHDGNPFDRGGRSSLSGLGSGGADDNDAQAGRLVAHSLTTSMQRLGDTSEETFVAFHATQDPIHHHHHHTPALGANSTIAVGVRRLTPTECERLQGFPDGWTDMGPDSRRYAALGDAVTVNVAEWIGRRLMEHG